MPRALSIRVFLIAFLVLACVYSAFDPVEAWWMPKCPVRFFTGLDCPGCGSQRAVHALLHGDFRDAMGFNALFVVMIPYILLMAYAELTRRRHPRLYRVLSGRAAIALLLGVMTAWTVWRNL